MVFSDITPGTRKYMSGCSCYCHTVIILIEWQIQSIGRNSIFGIFVNSIMQKARSHGKMSLLSTPGSVLIKTTLMKSSVEAFRCCPDCVLVKTSTDNSPGRQREVQTIQVLGAYTLLRSFCIPPGAKI